MKNIDEILLNSKTSIIILNFNQLSNFDKDIKLSPEINEINIFNFNKEKLNGYKFTFNNHIKKLQLLYSELDEEITFPELEELTISDMNLIKFINAPKLKSISFEDSFDDLNLINKYENIDTLGFLFIDDDKKITLPKKIKNLIVKECRIIFSNFDNLESLEYLTMGENIKLDVPENIKVLKLNGNINVKKLPKKLEKLCLENNEIINFGKLPNELIEFRCIECKNIMIESLPENLRILDLENIKIKDNLTFNDNLIELGVKALNLKKINIPSNLIKLDCSFNKIYKIDLPESLIELDCSHNLLNFLKLPSNLIKLNCSFNSIGNIKFNNVLESLNCSSNRLLNIITPNSLNEFICKNNIMIENIQINRNIKKIDLNNCNLRNIDFSNYENVEYLNISKNSLKEFPKLPKNVKFLYVSECNLDKFNVNLPNLEELCIAKNSINSLPKLSYNLKKLDCSHNKIGKLPNLNEFLNDLNCSFNKLTTLPKLPSTLKRLNCSYNYLTDLGEENEDLTFLVQINCAYNKLTKMPNVKKDISIQIEGNDIKTVIINDYELDLPIHKIKFKSDNVDIVTLPKGTVLFRGYLGGMKRIIDDFVGMKKDINNKYMLHPSYNVFFYPYPFVVENYFPKISNMAIFVLNNDIDISLNILPSINSRVDMNRDSDYLNNCNVVQNDKYSKGYGYDPCLTIDFIKKHKNVVGGIYIAGMDNADIKRISKNKIDSLKYRKYFKDSMNNVSVPEIVLYPLKERKDDYIITNPNVISYDWLKSNMDKYNYTPIITCDYKTEEQKSEFQEKIDCLLSPEGYIDHEKNYHMTIDPLTHFYVIKEFCDSDILERCVPIDEKDKLKYL